MRVQVVFFGILKDLVGGSEAQLQLPTGATAGDLWTVLQAQTPALARFQKSVAVAVNQQYSEAGTLLHEGDEVALLPPVSGGSGNATGHPDAKPTMSSAHCQLQYAPIAADSIIQRIRRGEDGAVVVFDGIVRNHSRGRRTLYLEYEAYEKMALAALEALAAEAKTRFEVRDCAVVHRLGRLEIGESSVLIVVASAHRAAAFDACRWIIDSMKRSVPIWKKEHFTDGAVWADGDPFPSSVATLPGSQSAPGGTLKPDGTAGTEFKNPANS
jgi:molybdopterin synthase catalytic subunit